MEGMVKASTKCLNLKLDSLVSTRDDASEWHFSHTYYVRAQ
jgi:hypothetical protein